MTTAVRMGSTYPSPCPAGPDFELCKRIATAVSGSCVFDKVGSCRNLTPAADEGTLDKGLPRETTTHQDSVGRG